MTIRAQAWNLLCDLARARGTDPRSVIVQAYRAAQEIAGIPWADCRTTEWVLIVEKLGGAA